MVMMVMMRSVMVVVVMTVMMSVVVADFRWRRTVMVVLGSSPFAGVWASVVAFTPGATAFVRCPVDTAAAGGTTTLLSRHSEASTFLMKIVSVSGSGFDQVGHVRSLGLALSRPIFFTISPRTSAIVRRPIRVKATFVRAAFALVRRNPVFSAVDTCWFRRLCSDDMRRRFRFHVDRRSHWSLSAAVRLGTEFPKVPTEIRSFVFTITPRASAIAVRSMSGITRAHWADAGESSVTPGATSV